MRRTRFAAEGRIWEGVVTEEGVLVAEGRAFDPDRVVWLPPVPPGGKAIGLALNYVEHAEELRMAPPEEPALFLKPSNAWIGHRAPVRYPPGVKVLHGEVELVVVIGRRCRKVRPEAAWEVIAGYTIGNDVTARDFVGNFYRPPVRAKGQDTFGPMGPWLVTPDEIPDPHRLSLRLFVNGRLAQEGHTSRMIHRIPDLIAFITSFMTLEPGDTLWTGTPRGIVPVRPGDVMRAEIEGIGVLENPVVEDEAAGGGDPLRMGGYFEEALGGAGGEDWLAWVKISHSFSMVYIDQPTVYYRLHTNNTSRSLEFLNRQNRLACHLAVTWDRFPTYPAHFRAKLLYYRFATAWHVEPKRVALGYLLRPFCRCGRGDGVRSWRTQAPEDSPEGGQGQQSIGRYQPGSPEGPWDGRATPGVGKPPTDPPHRRPDGRCGRGGLVGLCQPPEGLPGRARGKGPSGPGQGRIRSLSGDRHP